jgi:hypothetical protein
MNDVSFQSQDLSHVVDMSKFSISKDPKEIKRRERLAVLVVSIANFLMVVSMSLIK